MNKSNYLCLLVLIIINCIFIVRSSPTAKCQFDTPNSMLILNYQGDSSIVCQGHGITNCYNDDIICSTSDPYSTIKCSTKNDLKCVGSKIYCLIDNRFECSVDFPNNVTTGSPVTTTTTFSSTSSYSSTTSTTSSYSSTTSSTSSYSSTVSTTAGYSSTTSNPIGGFSSTTLNPIGGVSSAITTSSSSSEGPSPNCPGIPECGGYTRGVCMSNGECRCIYPYSGLDCSSEIIVIDPNHPSNQPSTNTTIENPSNSTTNTATKTPEELNSSLSPKLKFNLFASLLITIIISVLL
ncbi:hypothetical protein ACTFIU_006442 [Dictyostelium citrinum]